MYQSTLSLLSAIAVLPLAHGVAFGGPAPTGVATNADKAGNGWTPQPTKGPSVAELRRRQTNADPNTCGWVDGDYSSGITCPGSRTCALYTASGIGMAGCCDSDTQNCGWAKSCVNYDAWTKKSCDSDCQSDAFIRRCTDSATPYCVTWTYPSDGVADYGCADYNSGVETIYQTGVDLSYSYVTSMTLPTLTGDAVTGWDGEAASSESDVTQGFSDPFGDIFTTTESDAAEPTDGAAGGGSTPRPKTTGKKSVSVGLIVGAVIGGLVVLFIIGAAIIFFCVKKRKAKQLANNQQIFAAAQANQQPPQQPPMQQQHAPPMPVQSPPPQHNGYYASQDQKINHQTQVQEYGLPSPISNPPTPAPAYVQPYYATPNAAPPMPTQEAAPYVAPTSGAHEVDAITVPQTRPGQANLYEMGSGK